MGKAPCWTGSIAVVDLTKNEIKIEHQNPEFYRKYGGGSGMGMYYILKMLEKGADAFDPKNVITFFSGPLAGLPVSGCSRLTVNAKSPAGGAIGDSQVGGYIASSMKFAGFDGVVVIGKADHPVYILLKDGLAEIRDAAKIWGTTTADAEEILKEELQDRKIQVMQCGLAGEKLVRFASIMNMANRAAGRTGLGAVMGSKHLRALVVSGNAKVGSADPKEITKWGKWGVAFLPNNPDVSTVGEFGSAGLLSGQESTGTLPSYNFNEGTFVDWENLTGERMTETILTRRDTCYACAVRCKRVVETEYGGEKVLPEYGGPEYETIATLGTYCGIGDLKPIALANQLCNMYGLDTISCGATVAFAMECFKNGLLTEKDTDGIKLEFGNADALIAMIKKIAHREGFGDVLAEGSERAAQKIGRNADEYLITCKGTEAPAHMPQAKKTLGLIYAVNPFGADHQSHEHDPVYESENTTELSTRRLAKLGLDHLQPAASMNDEKIRFSFITEKYYSALDSYNLCQYVFGPAWNIYSADETIALLQAATGWDVSVDEYLEVGERRLNMMRAFNQREGFTRANDTLPKKFFKPLEGAGPTAGVSLSAEELEGFKDSYYKMAEWDASTGNPTVEKLKALELDWIEF